MAAAVRPIDTGLQPAAARSRRPSPTTPRGTACATSAFVHTLQNFFGTDKIAFSAFSNKSCTTRSFDRFSDALKEVIDARVWAGIHFRTADVQGAVLGKKVAHYLEKHYFQPVRNELALGNYPLLLIYKKEPEVTQVATHPQRGDFCFCKECENISRCLNESERCRPVKQNLEAQTRKIGVIQD